MAPEPTPPSPKASPPRRTLQKPAAIPEKKIADDEFMAAAIGDVEWLKQSLRFNKNTINYDQNGLSPIHLASIHGRLECLKLLIEKLRVDVNLPSSTGWRPVHLCISNQTGKRSFLCLSYLLGQGADPSIANEDGITPMHQAASEGHVQCLKALIEAGGLLDGEDYRGHKPFDLAKLWGHRKCARILATEQWHQDKASLSKDLAQLKKVSMERVLREIEKEDELRQDQQYYGDLAFREWLDTKELPLVGGEPSLSSKDGVSTVSSSSGQKSPSKESLHKPNSKRLPPSSDSKRAPTTIVEEPSSANRPFSEEDYVFDMPPSSASFLSGDARRHLISERSSKSAKKDNRPPSFFNPNEWNKSTKLPPTRRPYLPLLPDHYPRDEFTMKPKFPPKRLDKRVILSSIAQRSGVGYRQEEPLEAKIPDLPLDVVNNVLYPDEFQRPVVFKCKHIGDVHKKKHYELEQLPRQETGLHLTNDTESRLFQIGLVNLPAPPPPAPSSSSSKTRSSSKSSSANAMTLPEVMTMLSRMNKTPKFLATNG